MSLFRSFHFHAFDGSPLTGLSPTVHVYDRTGALVTWGALLTELGGGAYGITIADADVTTGVVISVDGGPSAADQYQVQTAAADGLVAVRFVWGDGSVYNGASLPTWGAAFDATGANQLSALPAWSAIAFGVFAATVSPTVLAARVAARVDAPEAGALPSDLTLTLTDEGGGPTDATPPTVTLISPAEGPIGTADPVVLEVTDETALGRVVLIARFDALGIEELIHNGTRFANAYAASSSRTAITGGYRLSVLRAGGWIAAPTIDVIALDAAGNEAA